LAQGRNNEELQDITLLGNQNNKYDFDYTPEVLESFDNKHQGRDYFVKFNCPEFTSLCPITGQPDIIMNDLIDLMDPHYIEVWGKFTPRGGISIDPYTNYGRPNSKYEQMAEHRLMNHDLYPEKIDNR
jgi:7-cyano-7-deazaguanine reductase